VLVFKKKKRKGYRRMKGHRQSYTSLRVEAIEG
jgi:ribosomal protein L21